MRILMVTPYYYPYCSGVSEYVRRLSEELVKRGNEVMVITSRHNKKLKRKERINKVEVKREFVLFRLSKGVFMPFFVFKTWLISKRYDIVNIHLPMIESGFISLLVRRKKLVATYHCDLRLNGGIIGRLIEKFYYLSARLVLKFIPNIVTYTKDYAKNSRLLKYFLNKCMFVYPPINEGDFSYKPINLRRMYNIKKKDVVIGFAGRFVYEKGIIYLLKAIPYILKEYPFSRFVFAGEYKDVAGGSNIRELEDLIDNYRKNILLLGNVCYRDLSSFYSMCDLLVLPSIDPLEAFGIVQIEAMYCGVPVIATNLPGVRVPVKKTGMGLIIKQRDEKDIARAIISILKNKKRYSRPKREVMKEFNIKKTIDFYEWFFKKVYSGSGIKS